MAIIPAFAVDGEIEFYQPDDTDEEQVWTNQGGMVGIRLTDRDLDVPQKRVIVPMASTDVSTDTSTAVTIEEGDTTIMLPWEVYSEDDPPTTTTLQANSLDFAFQDAIEEGDTIVVEGFTVREVIDIEVTPAVAYVAPVEAVEAVEADPDNNIDAVEAVEAVERVQPVATTTVITVNAAFGKDSVDGRDSDTDVTMYIVDNEDLEYSNCPECALAESLDDASGTRIDLDGFPIDSGITDATADLKTRVKGDEDDFVASDDLRFVRNDGTKVDITINDVNRNGDILLASSISGVNYVMYWSAVRNDTGGLVTVTSDVDGRGIALVLNETKPSSGVFQGVITTQAAVEDEDDADPPFDAAMLSVGKDDTVTVDYNDPDGDDDDVTATIQVETTPPTFDDFTPDHGFASKVERPEVEADVTDVDSGIPSEKKLWVIFAIGKTSNTNIIEKSEELLVDDRGSVSDITNGFHVRQAPTRSLTDEDVTIYWWVKAIDAAGNVGISDQMPQDSDGDPNNCDSASFDEMTLRNVNVKFIKDTDEDEDGNQSQDMVNGCQPYKISVDNTAPKLTGAFTGSFWDLDMELESGESDRTNDNPGDADPTSIRLEFNDDVDGSTVSADDFEVDGDAPLAAEHFAGASSSVFLTVPSLDPNDRPEVKMVGEVRDEAGNRRTTGTIKAATDKIAPTLEVSLEGTAGGSDRPVTDKSITVTIVSDEAISAPKVSVYHLGADNDRELGEDEEKMALTGPFLKTASPVKGESRTYSAKIDRNNAGLYNVVVTATDIAGSSNEASVGATKGPVDTGDDTSAILYEVDNDLAGMEVIPETIDDPDAFITLDFTAEGSEYPDGKNPADEDVDYDSYTAVTIVSAMLGDLDITDSLSANSAGNKYLYKASDLEIGKHTISVEIMDEAGNEKDFSTKIEITERKPFSLALSPGWNLVSIPSPPANGDINTVIPADHPADTVLTYDPLVPGGWLTAVRGGDGDFTGTLTMITATRAYWIHTDSFEALDVDVPKPSVGQAVFLPTITISKGWNLIPALDVDGDEEVGTAMHYFRSISDDVAAAYRFDTVLNSWLSVELEDTSATGEDDNSEMIERGRGYWVYSTKAGTLVP